MLKNNTGYSTAEKINIQLCMITVALYNKNSETNSGERRQGLSFIEVNIRITLQTIRLEPVTGTL